ncbi:MAG: VCBS repeat-containing protein [Acidobacteria bacterium]|nr:VCBS repeat-containing protein [Acidobacteriota bacterium]
MNLLLPFRHRSFLAAASVLVAVVCAALPQEKPGVPAQSAAKPQRPAEASAEAIRLNNLGVAYMNQQRMEQGLKNFQEALARAPALTTARLNQGIALLSLQRLEPAREALLEVTRREPGRVRAWYNLGLLYRNLGEAEKALEAFEQAVKLAPDDADTHYFIGLLHTQLQQYEKAIAALQRALALNPLHVSAEFGLARAYQRAGDSAKSREHLVRFQKLTQEKLGSPMSLVYGDQGPLSLAEDVAGAASSVPPAIPVKFVSVPAAESGLRFVHSGLRSPEIRPDPVSKRASPHGEPAYVEGSGACFFDYDNDGRSDLFLVNAGQDAASVLYHNVGGRFVDVTRETGMEVRGLGMACTAGDYDNDGWTDLAVTLSDRVILLRNDGKGHFQDVTRAAGIRPDPCPGAALFLDFDHDGDIDLYLTGCAVSHVGGKFRRPDGGEYDLRNVLWRNNGNGTFTDWTEAAGLEGPELGFMAVAADFNNDRAVDLLISDDLRGGAHLNENMPPLLLLNPREGHFKPVRPWKSFGRGETRAAAIFDFNKDGWMDVAFTHTNSPSITLWRNLDGKNFAGQRLPYRTSEWEASLGLAVLDCDNDGWLDLAGVIGDASDPSDTGHVILLRNEGAGFRDVSEETGLSRIKLTNPRSLITADVDGDGDTDLLITQNGGPPVLLRNDGGNKNNWLRISLRGLADNKSAIGTKVEVFAGALWQKFEVQSSSGYLGQSATDILVGLGGERQADIVRLLWPTGVLQDEIEIPARKTEAITEIDRRGSSCPILFAWNGSRYEFIADAIGPGIVGHWVAPGERNIPDPTEYLKVPGESVRPRDGRLSFRFIEPMEELVYLDRVRLLAVDHPAGVEVHPNERFAAVPPFPEFKVISSRDARPPLGAWDDRGQNVLPELLERDRRYVTGFADAPFKGFAETHWVELDLGSVNTSVPLRLLLHGFTDYFTATSVYAAHQAGVTATVPYVEALDASGRWQRVVDDMGFPAGLARTMVADLTGRLPAGTRRIRIVTNLKIYWDQISVDTSPEGISVRLTEAPLTQAALGFRGYPREVRGNPSADITYDYEQVSLTGPYARASGNYTRYGGVRSLLTRADDKFVIFGSGDEVALEFDPGGLPPLPRGWTRDFFFYVDGFSKDMDFYAAHADTIEPLPFHAMDRYPYPETTHYPGGKSHHDYLLNFNTRPISGRSAPGFRFDFPNKRR